MLDNIIEKFNQIAPMNDNLEGFVQVMNLPDEQFNMIYDELKGRMEAILNSRQFQQEIIMNLEAMGAQAEDIENDITGVQEFINEINADDSVSDKKKDFLVTLINKGVLSTYEFAKNPRERITVKIERISSNAKIPEYAHDSDAGCDVFAAEEVTLMAGETKIVKTGIKVAIPAGYEIQVRPRSGLSSKTGLRIANAPGTIDSNYRGEIGVIMTNIGTNALETIHEGDKIAQLVIAPTPMIKWVETTVSEDTDRGTEGFGSTDKN